MAPAAAGGGKRSRQPEPAGALIGQYPFACAPRAAFSHPVQLCVPLIECIVAGALGRSQLPASCRHTARILGLPCTVQRSLRVSNPLQGLLH